MFKDGYENGLCKSCHGERTEQGHDPCIANLPGVVYACCGHGQEAGYIKFEDGRVLNFSPIDVTLDIPSTKSKDGIPIFQLFDAGRRIFNFQTAKVELRKK